MLSNKVHYSALDQTRVLSSFPDVVSTCSDDETFGKARLATCLPLDLDTRTNLLF